MAASTVPIDGQVYKIEISTDNGVTFVALGWQQDSAVNLTGETREISSKNVCYWREYRPSASAWTMSGTAENVGDATPDLNQSDCFGLINTLCKVKVTAYDCAGAPVTGEMEYEGDAIITELTLTYPQKDTATYTYSFQGSGELVEAVIV